MGHSLDDVDEVWVATDFIRAAVQRATTKPVTKIPTPVVPRVERAYRRADFGLPDDRFLFLFSFDFNAYSVRKNPEAVLAAFRRAFPPGRNDVGLVVKSINGRNRPDDLARIEALIAGDQRITLIDRRFTRDEVFGLQQVVDSYVSLHRAEGLGLGLAESMYFGKPMIGTRYSGNLEFMNAQNSCLVDFDLIPVPPGNYPIDFKARSGRTPTWGMRPTGWCALSTTWNSGSESRSAASRHPKSILPTRMRPN